MELLVIGVHKGINTVIFDSPRAYLHANIPTGKKVLLKLKGSIVDIMCDTDP